MAQTMNSDMGQTLPKINIQLDSTRRQDMAGADVLGGNKQKSEDKDADMEVVPMVEMMKTAFQQSTGPSVAGPPKSPARSSGGSSDNSRGSFSSNNSSGSRSTGLRSTQLSASRRRAPGCIPMSVDADLPPGSGTPRGV